jgi:hypothetical protein
MKPFDFQASFTGICAVVPDNSDLGKATRAVVVMPGAEPAGPRKPALDGAELCPHYASVWSYLDSSGKPTSTPVKLLSLAQRRLTFVIEEANPGLNRFQVVSGGAAGVDNLLKLEYAAPDYRLLDPACVDFPPPPFVQAQAAFARGTLRSVRASNAWRFPRTLDGDGARHVCAHDAVLELKQLTRLTLVAESFDGKLRQEIHLSPAVGADFVEVMVSNSCIDYGTAQPVANGGYALPDEDFRWYYELLPRASQVAIVNLLDGLPLPFPYPIQAPAPPPLMAPGSQVARFAGHGNCWPMLAFTASTNVVSGLVGQSRKAMAYQPKAANKKTTTHTKPRRPRKPQRRPRKP